MTIEQVLPAAVADVDILIDAADGTFEARLLVAGPVVGGSPLAGFTGHWLARDGLILTAITAPVSTGYEPASGG